MRSGASRFEFTMLAVPIVGVGLPGGRELWNVGRTGAAADGNVLTRSGAYDGQIDRRERFTSADASPDPSPPPAGCGAHLDAEDAAGDARVTS